MLPATRIPVEIITGFLGAGKSTLLNRLLRHPAMADAAVIVNEFGEVGIDHLLVEASGDSMVELSNGCLCCTVRGELADTLLGFRDAMSEGRMKTLSRIVIETTGLADPGPVIQSIIGHPELSASFALDGVVTLVDCVNGLSTLDHHEEARRQVAYADRLILSKLSLADENQVLPLRQRLRALNPTAPMLDGDADGVADPAMLAAGLYDPATRTADVRRWLHDEVIADDHVCNDHCDHHHHDHSHHHHHGGGHGHRHDDGIESFSILHDRPVAPAALAMFVDLLRSAHAEKLLRMKAIVQLADDPERPLVLHGVQSVFHTPERLERWPEASDRRSRLVLITQGLSQEFVRELFDAFTGTPRVDRPDRQALEDNPLAIPGMKM
jgi:G3E family GTPase